MYLFVTVYCIYWLRWISSSHPFSFPFHMVIWIVVVGVSWPHPNTLDSTSAARSSGTPYTR